MARNWAALTPQLLEARDGRTNMRCDVTAKRSLKLPACHMENGQCCLCLVFIGMARGGAVKFATNNVRDEFFRLGKYFWRSLIDMDVPCVIYRFCFEGI